jgi:hypothetical protein
MLVELLATSVPEYPVPPVVDMVFIASCYFWDAAARAGVMVAFTDIDAVNTVGNTYDSVDSLVASSGIAVDDAGNVTATEAAVVGRQRALALAAAAPAQVSAPHPARRRLELVLQSLPPSPANTTQQMFTFNILGPTQCAVGTMARALLAGGGAAVVAASAAAQLANVTGLDLTAAIAPSSVTLISLTFSRSLWTLLWAWFARNIATVLAGAGSLAALALVLACCARLRGAARRRRREKADERLQARLRELQEAARARSMQAAAALAGRWARVRRALLARLKAARFQRAAVMVAAEPRRRAAADGAAATLRRSAAGALLTLKAKLEAGLSRGREVLHMQPVGAGGGERRGEGVAPGDAVLQVLGPRRGAGAGAALAGRGFRQLPL